MTQQQREAIAGMVRASPSDPAGDLHEQRPLSDKMITAACQGLLDTGQDVARVALAAESAGAGPAAVTPSAIGRAGLPQPAPAVLMSPRADLAGTGDSLKTKADADPVIAADAARVRARDYPDGAGAFLRAHTGTAAAETAGQQE